MKSFAPIIFFGIIACTSKPQPTEDYIKEIDTWKTERLSALRGEKGFINLAGLFWLKEGINSFGSSNTNSLIFPKEKSEGIMGSFLWANDSVLIIPAKDVVIVSNGNELTNQQLAYHDSLVKIPEYSYNSLRWTVIKRGDQYGVRLRDLNHPMLSNMIPIEYFPLNLSFQVEAQFTPYDPPRYRPTTNVLGMTYDAKIPGILSFELGGEHYEFEPNIDGDKLHLRFTDLTTGEETYGLGRYLHIDMPESEGLVTVDFNKAYNPPCAFTEFATCPIPPKENHLALKAQVGEKDYH